MLAKRGMVLAGAAVHVFGSALPQTTYGDSLRPLVNSKGLQDLVTTEGLWGNLVQLDSIAKAHSGNRAFGFPGYAASVEYILSRTKNSSNFRTWTQDFPALFQHVDSISLSVSSVPYTVIGLSYSPSTSAEGVTAPLVLGPSGTEACVKGAYADLDVSGKIVLVQRGTCPDGTTFAGRVKPAAAAGAIAVLLYNNVETPVTAGTLSAPNPKEYVPAGFINLSDGQALAARIAAGEEVEASFQQTQTVETRITQNVFTETLDGDASNVIMLGAHLDSVVAGSGTSLILEVKTALEKFRVKNRVRFAWWGAEENGLLGSKFYTQNLNTTDANSILAYLNFDMVSRGYFGVFDGDGSTHNLTAPPGSAFIEKTFVDHLTGKGINVTAARFTGGSDYQSFFNIGKPVGGLHTGTGVDQDPCYHQACDTIENPNATTLTVNAQAAAHVLSVLATRGTEFIPKSPVNGTVTSRGLLGREIEWTTDEEDRHLATCGNNI